MNTPMIRLAKPGEEADIHTAHMRSIQEICILDHGEEEIQGWGSRPLENRWIEEIKTKLVWVIETEYKIQGLGYLRVLKDETGPYGYLHALYLTPDVTGVGLGHKLACTIIKKSKELSLETLRLDSTITAYQFYKRLGFQDNGNKKKVKIGGHPVTCFPMIKKL